MKTPESPAEISLDWLREALPWGRPGGEPVSADVEPEFGAKSYLGKIARVKLRYAGADPGPPSILVKFQSTVTDKEMEARIYRLLSEHTELSVPRLLGAFDPGTLILEDLAPARAGPEAGCTPARARDVLAVLAEIHGRFWGDSRVPAVSSDKFASVIEYRMSQSWDVFLSRYREMIGGALGDFEWMRANARIVSAHRLGEPSTLFHGDVGPANLLFRDDGRARPVLIDWQLSGRGLAANDVSFFLIPNLTVPQRREHEETLVGDYHRALPDHVRTGYPLDRLMLDYRACTTRSMLTAVMLVGPFFGDAPGLKERADATAERVIAAVQDLKPVDAYRQLAGI